MEPLKPTHAEPYTALAYVYDEVMKDVSYAAWTEYIDRIIQLHHPEAVDLMELACGTGTMAVEMSHLDEYRILATDQSAQMIEMARKKAARFGAMVEFDVMDFLDLRVDRCFDVVYMVFDSINYLHEKEKIERLHSNVFSHLRPGGLFVFDFTTPRNSMKAIRYLDKMSGQIGPWHFERSSRYDAEERVHVNEFVITKGAVSMEGDVNVDGGVDSAVSVDGAVSVDSDVARADESPVRFEEEHRQKIYTLHEMLSLSSKTSFSLLGAYNGFTLEPAGQKSLRVTMVLQRPEL